MLFLPLVYSIAQQKWKSQLWWFWCKVLGILHKHAGANWRVQPSGDPLIQGRREETTQRRSSKGFLWQVELCQVYAKWQYAGDTFARQAIDFREGFNAQGAIVHDSVDIQGHLPSAAKQCQADSRKAWCVVFSKLMWLMILMTQHHSWQNSAAALVLMIRWWMVMAPHQFDDAKLLLSKLVTKSSTPRPAPSLRKELPVVAEFLHLLE